MFKKNRLLSLPSPLLALGLSALLLMIFYGAWHYAFHTPWQVYRANVQHINQLTQRLQREKSWLAHWPKRVQPLKLGDLDEQITGNALQQAVFISALNQKDALHRQVTLLGTFLPLNRFLHQLTQQFSAWSITQVHLTQSTNTDSPLALNIEWQKGLISIPMTCFMPSISAKDPFQRALNDEDRLTRYSIAQIEWLGLLMDVHHQAALIRLPNRYIQLIKPGDTLGTEQWRLMQLTTRSAEFIDKQQQRHQLTLDLQQSQGESL